MTRWEKIRALQQYIKDNLNFDKQLGIMQTGIGGHRICELSLLQQVTADILPTVYIELGAGCGAGMKAVHDARTNTKVIGFDWKEPTRAILPYIQHLFFVRDILKESERVMAEVAAFRSSSP